MSTLVRKQGKAIGTYLLILFMLFPNFAHASSNQVTKAESAVVSLENAAKRDLTRKTNLERAEQLIRPAEREVAKLKNGTTKTQLQKKTTTAKNKITTARSVFDAEAAVKALETAANRNLTTRTNLERAESLVRPAERAVAKLKSGTKKTQLQRKITTVKDKITAARSVFDAEAAVKALEAAASRNLTGNANLEQAESLVRPAERAVAKLKNGTKKTQLQNKTKTAKDKVTTARTVFNAEAAVKAYENASISTMARVATAEKLELDARNAVNLVKSSTTRRDFNNRIDAKKLLVDAQKQEFNQREIATAAVVAYENVSLTTLLELANVEALEQSARAQVNLVGSSTIRSSLFSRITAKSTLVEASKQQLREAQVPSLHNSQLVKHPGEVFINEEYTFEVLIRDTNNIPMEGVTTFSLNDGSIVEVVDNGSGNYQITAIYSKDKAETKSINLRIHRASNINVVQLGSLHFKVREGEGIPSISKTSYTHPIGDVFVREAFTFEVTLRDINDQLVTGQDDRMSVNKGWYSIIEKEGHPGVYVVEITHEQVKNENFKVMWNGIQLFEIRVDIKAPVGPGIPSPATSTMTRPEAIYVNEDFVVEVTVRDIQSNPVNGIDPSRFTAPQGHAELMGVKELGNGVYEITLRTNRQKDKESFKIAVDGMDLVEIKDVPVIGSRESGVPNIMNSSMEAQVQPIYVNEPFIITLTIKDFNADPVTGIAANRFSAPQGHADIRKVEEKANGVYEVSFTGNRARAMENFKVAIDGSDFIELRGIAVNPPREPGLVNYSMSTIVGPIGNVYVNEPFLVTATLRDFSGNVIAGIAPNLFVAPQGHANITSVVETSPGTYQIMLTGNRQSSNEQIRVEVNGVDVFGLNNIVVVTKPVQPVQPVEQGDENEPIISIGTPFALTSTVAKPVGLVLQNQPFTFQVTIRDAKGEPIPNIASQIRVKDATSSSAIESETTPGLYTVTATRNQSPRTEHLWLQLNTQDFIQLRNYTIQSGANTPTASTSEVEFPTGLVVNESFTFSITVRDEQGNLRGGLEDSILTGYNNIRIDSSKETSEGVYTITATPTAAFVNQNIWIRITGLGLNNNNFFQVENISAVAADTNIQTPSRANTEVVEFPNVLTANQPFTFKIKIKDTFNQPILTVTKENLSANSSTVVSDVVHLGEGEYEVTAQRNTVGTTKVKFEYTLPGTSQKRDVIEFNYLVFN
ncbi:MAG: hypothetical protein ACK4M9_04210 [Anaerobacillus sp.]|uniref:hypothetical protein n=1 Tax=Anaerobacillus sp. TaxID=1872506 RepID=UPI003918F055